MGNFTRSLTTAFTAPLPPLHMAHHVFPADVVGPTWRRSALRLRRREWAPGRLLSAHCQIAIYGLLAGVALSASLWFGPPRLPAVGVLSAVPLPTWLPLAMISCLVCASLYGSGRARVRTHLLLSAVVLLLLLCAANIARLQPWVFHYALMLMCCARITRPSTPGPNSVDDAARCEWANLWLCRVVLSGAYVYGGLGKLNASFGSEVVPFLFAPVIDLGTVDVQHLRAVGVILALAEAGVGVCLWLSPTRRLAVVAGVVLHGTVLAMLGPAGQNYNAVIWPWNLAMAAFLTLQWHAPSTRPGVDVWHALRWRGRTIFAFSLLTPALGLIGRWDANLSFQLYTGSSTVGIVRFAESSAPCFPRTAQSLMRPSARAGAPNTELELNLHEWSMQAYATPLYAESRVILSTFQQLCDGCVLDAWRPTLTIRPRARWFAPPAADSVYRCPVARRHTQAMVSMR